ncbi:hypothetical protein [Lacrimispora brassicae]
MKTHNKTLVGLFVFLFICIVGIFLVWIKSMYSVKESPTLQGTYTCEKLPFASMVFDLDDNYSFYYNDYDEKDKGTYSKGLDNEHFINSSKFHNTKILYNGKKKTFTVMIDGETYLFKQINRLPIINLETK